MELDLAQPLLPIVRRLTSPAARRYLAGWAGGSALHVLAPRQLAARATNVEGSREMLSLTPAALYVQLVVAECNRALPPPWSPRSTLRARNWAWLIGGAAQWFSGQTDYARPAIARRLREDARPDFPPVAARCRAARRHGDRPDRARGGRRARGRARVLVAAGRAARGAVAVFGGRAMVHSEGTWRAHLARMAGR